MTRGRPGHPSLPARETRAYTHETRPRVLGALSRTLPLSLPPPPAVRMFELDKWYLDLVTDRGAATIGYAGVCRVGPTSVRFASLLHASPESPAIERTTLRGVRFPVHDGDLLRWNIPALRFEGCWEPIGAPISQQLLNTERGCVEWHCHVSRARVTSQIEGAAQIGLGYAERLHITLPLWRLPFRTLRWGRYLSDRHGLVWIEWADGLERRWIWSDDRAEPAARLDANGVSGLPSHGELRFEDRRVVRDRRVLESVGRVLPPAIRDRFGPLAGMREQKWLSRSLLLHEDMVADRGWTIHEEVRW